MTAALVLVGALLGALGTWAAMRRRSADLRRQVDRYRASIVFTRRT